MTDTTVTGRCDHIVGFSESAFPQYGDADHLVHLSEVFDPVSSDLSISFSYCPICGSSLAPALLK